MPITANYPDRKSWLTIDSNSDFPIQNIPFGVFLTKEFNIISHYIVTHHITSHHITSNHKT